VTWTRSTIADLRIVSKAVHHAARHRITLPLNWESLVSAGDYSKKPMASND
jgi:hypothetical protein